MTVQDRPSIQERLEAIDASIDEKLGEAIAPAQQLLGLFVAKERVRHWQIFVFLLMDLTIAGVFYLNIAVPLWQTGVETVKQTKQIAEKIIFGKDNPCLLIQKPVAGGMPMTSSFGMRVHPISGNQRMHAGVDYAPTRADYVKGVPAIAAYRGRVEFADTKGGYGKTVVLRHSKQVTTLYAHLEEIYVKPGDRIGVATPVGRIGSTGDSTGPHLHFEVRVNDTPVNPEEFLNKKWCPNVK